MFRENEGQGWCAGDAGSVLAAWSFIVSLQHGNRKNGFKLNVDKRELMFVAGSFASNLEETQGKLLKVQDHV